MDMMMRLMMGVILYGCLIPTYAFAANLRLPKKNIILGVTVPYAHHDDTGVEAVCATYLKRIRILTVAVLVLSLPIWFVPMSVQILMLMTAFMIFIAGDMVIFVKANRALTAIKRESNWTEVSHTVPAAVDLRAMEEKNRPLPRLIFILPCLIAAVPLVFMVQDLLAGTFIWGQVIAYSAMILTIPLILVLTEAMRRQNAEIVGTNSDFNVILTRIRRREWVRCMAITAWMLAITTIATWFAMDIPEFLFLGVVLGLSLIVVVYAFRAEFAVRRAQERFTQLAGDTLPVDDDKHWIWGLFYYNRDDKRLIIKDRVGMNMSMNFAKPIGMILMVAAGLTILVMPLIGVWTVAQEFTPITYSVEGHVVTAAQLRTRTFDLGERFGAEVLDTLPRSTRTAGTAIGTLREGRFNFDDIGSAWVLFYTDQPPFLVLTAEDGQVLVFNYDPVFTPLVRSTLLR